MNTIELKNNQAVMASCNEGVLAIAKAVQSASRGKLAFTLEGTRVSDLDKKALASIDNEKTVDLLSRLVDMPLRAGNYPLENLLPLARKIKKDTGKLLDNFYSSDFTFVAEDTALNLDSRALNVLMLGSAGMGVVSATQDMVSAFTNAGYYGRSFPMFDPSKKGAPVQGYGVVSGEPVLVHAPFQVPNIILLFDHKLFPMLKGILNGYKGVEPSQITILINTSMDVATLRATANFHQDYSLYTVDATALIRGRRIPPNYAMIGAMLGVLGDETVDIHAFTDVVTGLLTQKFGPGAKVDGNVEAFNIARQQVIGEPSKTSWSDALGESQEMKVAKGQEIRFADGNRAIAQAVREVLNQYPSVVAAYPITPQTQIVEYLAQMIADGELTAEGVAPESEHGAGGAVLGAARDRVLSFTATCSQGFALMSEVVHAMAGLRMGNVMISNVLRSLNAPLDVENDHSDLYKVGLDAGFLVFMTRNVQQAYDFHLLGYLVSLYAEYRKREINGTEQLEMIPDRSIMLPVLVASEGFEVSHAPECFHGLSKEMVESLYNMPKYDYVRTFVETPNQSIMGTLQLSNARFDTDYQRDVAMNLALEVIPDVLEDFKKLTGRQYGMLDAFNLENSDIVFVVAGAAAGTFEAVAQEFSKQDINVAIVHPNVIRPFPKEAWIDALKGRKVFVFDRDDPFGSVGGRLYTELAGVVNEYQLAQEGTLLYSRIYGLGGRTPSVPLVRDEILKALKDSTGEISLSRAKQYVGVNI